MVIVIDRFVKCVWDLIFDALIYLLGVNENKRSKPNNFNEIECISTLI